MKEKTKMWITLISIFAVAMIVIAFGSFIESQKNSDLMPIAKGKEIHVNESKAGKLELKDEKETTEVKKETEKKIREKVSYNEIKLSE